MNQTTQQEKDTDITKKYQLHTRAYRNVPLDVDVMAEIDRIAADEKISFNDVINFLLRDAILLDEDEEPSTNEGDDDGS